MKKNKYQFFGKDEIYGRTGLENGIHQSGFPLIKFRNFYTIKLTADQKKDEEKALKDALFHQKTKSFLRKAGITKL